MTLDIESALTGGVRCAVSRNGAVLAAAYAAVAVVWQVSVNSLFAATVFADLDEAVGSPTVDAPAPVLTVAAVVMLAVLTHVGVVAIRVFVGGHRDSIPSELYTRNAAFAVLNMIVGGIVFSIILLLGTLAFVVPGVIAYVAFAFMSVYVAVEDDNFVAAFRNSWRLTRGHWVRLFALLLVVMIGVGVIAGVVTFATTFGIAVAGGSDAATLATVVVYAPLWLVIMGVLAEAFTQLRADAEPTLG